MLAEELPPKEWAGTFLDDSNFDDFITTFNSEVEAAHYIYNYELARKEAKAYLMGLKSVIYCDADESDRLRQEANAFYRKSESLEHAAVLYSRAIYKAPKDSPSLARAHADRAALLYKLQEYEAAYEDCTYAMKFNHSKADAVLSRQAAIAWKLKNFDKLKECIHRFQDMNISIPETIIAYSQRLKNVKPPEPPNNLKTFTQFKKIRVVQTEDRGRFTVADEPIKAGEMIMEEKAAVFVPDSKAKEIMNEFLTKEGSGTVFMCDNCAEVDIAPFPCYECRAAFYCSTKCRNEHMAVHQFECKGNKVCLFNYMQNEHLAFRCLVSTFDRLLRELTDFTNGTEIQSAMELWPIVMQTCKNGELLGIFTNFQQHQENRVLLQDLMLATLLCSYLSEETDFFKRTRHQRLAMMPSDFEWRVLVTALLLRYFSQSDFNCECVNRFVSIKPFATRSFLEEGLFKAVEMRSTMGGIYPRFCLLNHSCHCNTFVLHTNLKSGLRSRRPIAKGEEISHDYLWCSAKQSKEERMTQLSYYYNFTCDCSRCKNEEGALCVRAAGVICECGGVCLLCNKDAACSLCGKHSDAEAYLNELKDSYEFDDCPETYHYMYDTYCTLKDSLGNNGTVILADCADNILTKFTTIINENDKKVYDDEEINLQMVKIAVDALELTKNEYVPALNRARYAVFLLHLLAVRNMKGFPELQCQYRELIEEALWVVTGKAKKLFEETLNLYCT